MGTPANIVALHSSGQWGVTYVGYDGMPYGVGLMLHDHYADQALVDEMLAGGHMSSLGENLTPAETTFYIRDKGEEDVDTDYFSTFEEAWEYAKESHGQYTYVWDGQVWHYDGKPLSQHREEDW